MALPRPITIRLLCLVAVSTVFAVAWQHFNAIPLLVIGQPSTTGLLQREKEQPFFTELKETTGQPFKVTYRPLDSTGLKDNYQLQMLMNGDFDLVSLRFVQNATVEPSLAGIDLLGLSQNYGTAKKIIDAYSGTVDRYLQERFQAKLLGIWTFGSQQIFCKQPIRRLGDLKGLKVRVASANLSALISELGGTPAVIPFDQVRDALAIGLVDCAITSAASANYAGWTEQTRFAFPISVHFGLNGYAISLKKWSSLSSHQRLILESAFKKYLDDLWRYSEDLQADSISCTTGGPCRKGKAHDLHLVMPSSHDQWLLREISLRKVVPAWGKECDRVHPGCFKEWQRKVGPIVRSEHANRVLR